MTSIFGNTSSTTAGNRHLVEFKAGRMNMVGKMVHPDKRKGLLYIYSAEDGLIHFCWKDRTTGHIEDDLIIFPDDCEFKRVDQCKTGRVYILKFKSSNRKLFFWMQEPETEKDEEFCRRINEILNNPPSASSGSSGRTEEGLQYMLNNMSQQQLMQLFGGVGQVGLSSLLGSINRSSGGRNANSSSLNTSSSTGSRTTSSTAATTAVTATPTNTTQPSAPRAPRKTNSSGSDSQSKSSAGGSGSSNQLLTELQNYLAGMNTGSKQNVDLATSFNVEAINSILSDPERVSALKDHLPNTDASEDDKKSSDDVKNQLKDTVVSPQFQQALSMFSSALQSGQLGPVVSQFKLNDQAIEAANNGDLEQFIKALENASIKSSEPSPKSKSDDENDDTKN